MIRRPPRSTLSSSTTLVRSEKAGTVTITATYTEPISNTPTISFAVAGVGTLTLNSTAKASNTQIVYSATAGRVTAQGGDAYRSSVTATHTRPASDALPLTTI